MSAEATAVAQQRAPRLTAFESEFIQTVLEHRGVFHPSQSDFTAALQVLQRYDEQCIANTCRDDGYVPRFAAGNLVALRAKAYVMFGSIRPSPAQWHKAHAALYGPQLCETCE